MNIRMYNVQFGESILMTEDGQTPFLIDFGSKTPHTLQAVADDVAVQCNNRLDLLITHFHEDHTNGIYNNHRYGLFDRVQEGIVYMPSLLEMQHTPAHFSFLRIDTVIDFLDAIREGHNFQGRLYKILQALNNGRRHVRFLQRGSEFTVCGIPCKVLWPCFDKISLDSRLNKTTADKIIRLLNHLERHAANTLKQKLHELDITMYDQPEINAGAMSLIIMDAYNAMLVDAFRTMPDVSQDILHRLQELYHALSDIAGEISRHLTSKDKSEIRKSIHNLIDKKNRVSIVFHDIPRKGSSRFLMTGDFEKKDYAYISTPTDPPTVSNRYRVIKAPHHGSDSHFIYTFPRCRDIIISNGEGNDNYHEITYGYGTVYRSNRGTTQIHCTNQRCELFKSSPPNHRCANCPGHTSNHIDIPL